MHCPLVTLHDFTNSFTISILSSLIFNLYYKIPLLLFWKELLCGNCSDEFLLCVCVIAEGVICS